MKKWILAGLVFYVLPSLAALAPYEKAVSKGKVTFYKESSVTAEQFSGMPYATKPDPAWLESTSPLTKSMRQALTPEDFKKMTQEEIDQIYIRLSSGPIVPGSYKGLAMMRSSTASGIKNFILKKIHGVQLVGSVVCGQKDLFECFMGFAWEGKRIYAPDSATGEYQLRNAVSKTTALGIKTALMPAQKQLDPRNWLLRTISPFYGDLKYMILPAHLYCGQSLIDHRKESIIADYSWGSDFSPFIDGIDDIFGRDLLNVREEIRMVRPGLYIGRVYTQKIFLFSFVLHNPEAEKVASQEAQWPADACFNGKGTR